MKFLQDLVPGCNKVTGKALMLDEIINYVQSLQRQVEFFSMKLAIVNPRLDFNMEATLTKDIKIYLPSLYLLPSSCTQVFLTLFVICHLFLVTSIAQSLSQAMSHTP
ncbi:hypothetical protein AQUCO_00500525v1 [Aquilegia coerulea]|uniref:BHLH domain-containing protein n=1 Tax=Aquilegia coerulea TaxID=218851 RepID=A0A2G5ESB9_AQUCA|nr:hypothetical protein AQUCO_00500525v1 [Aquilegia coerulea]PIA58635.1 hypothetical protein AQUCO_00500525v1 [Aquilegia coerulea]PIA58636.1 hypothetical protein AQUCO_00500525v1 [Aquilegia coerulea]PIA58637.1 hypothetical protein AQUCO_00500525v1 [Aquilegia coerulea]